MKAPAPAELQRWSEEVALNPAALAFVPLARAYRKQGRRDAALRLVLRGLEHNATHVEAHTLLALLYFESGQRSSAYDEWSIVLRLEPDNFEALRGMGFYHLEQNDDASALRSLQRAATIRPKDLSVQEALKLINEQNQPAEPWQPAELMPWEEPDPWAAAREEPGPVAEVETEEVNTVAEPIAEIAVVEAAVVTSKPLPATVPAEALQAPVRPMEYRGAAAPVEPIAHPLADPARLFDVIMRDGQILGALLVDAQGLVLAGSLGSAPASKADLLGALLGGAIEEAARASEHLALGKWQGILLDADHAMLHLSPVRAHAGATEAKEDQPRTSDVILVLAAERGTPPGWMLRSAHQASVLAARFLEAYE